jgi:hypothetical protein
MSPTKRIEKLTPAQVDRLAEFRERWLARGLATGPCDRKAMEAAADEAYRAAGLPVPAIKIWLGSPLAGAIGAHLLMQMPKLSGDQVRDQVRAQVGDQVRAQVRDQVGAQVRDQVRAQVRAQVWRAGYGQHDANWLAFYEFFGDVCGLEVCGRLRGLNLLSECGWWWPFAGAVILTERPTSIHRDDRNRLHNVAGAALTYPDGFALHAVHGIRVSADIIDNPASITCERIGGESNAEIRRVMIELYGANRYLLDSGAKVIHRDAVGILYRKELSNDEPIVMVRVLNSTPEPDGVMSREEAIAVFGDAAKAAIDAPEGSRFKEYMIRVPPNLTKAHDAVAWTFNLSSGEYHPAIES